MTTRPELPNFRLDETKSPLLVEAGGVTSYDIRGFARFGVSLVSFQFGGGGAVGKLDYPQRAFRKVTNVFEVDIAQRVTSFLRGLTIRVA